MIETPEQQFRSNLEQLATIYSKAMTALEESGAIIEAQLDALSASHFEAFHNPKTVTQAGPLIVDRSTFCAVYRGRRCPLGNTLAFKFLERLARHPGQYVSHEVLFRDVWKAIREPASLRSVVRELRSKLREARLLELADAIDGRVAGHYRLILNRAK